MLQTKTFKPSPFFKTRRYVSDKWKNDRDGFITLLALITVISLYLLGMFFWLHYEFNRPVQIWKIHDFIGNYLAVKASKGIYRKLFKHNKG